MLSFARGMGKEAEAWGYGDSFFLRFAPRYVKVCAYFHSFSHSMVRAEQ